MTDKIKETMKPAPKATPKKVNIKGTAKPVRAKLKDEDIEKKMKSLLADTNALIKQKQADEKRFKHLLVVRNRTQLLISFWDRLIRQGGIKQ